MPFGKIDSVFVESLGYNISHVVGDFYNLTRYGTDLKPTDVSLLKDEKKYASSLIIYGMMSLASMAILVVLLMVFCACNCLFRKQPPYGMKHNRAYWIPAILIVVVVVATMLTYILGFMANAKLLDGWKSICGEFEDFVDILKSVYNDTKRVVDENKIIEILNDVEKNLGDAKDQAHNTPLEPEIAGYLDKCKQLKSAVIPGMEDLKKVIDDKQLSDAFHHLSNYSGDCLDYQQQAKSGLLSFVVVSALLTLIFVLGVIVKCCRIPSCIIAFIIFNIITIVAIFTFLLLIMGSNFCIESKPYLRKNIDESVLKYYMDCTDSNSPSPPDGSLEKMFADVQKQLNDGQKQLKTLQKQLADSIKECDQLGQSKQLCDLLNNVQTLATNLNSEIDEIATFVKQIISKVKCESITPIINRTLSSICTPLYNSIFLTFSNAFLASIGYFLLMALTIYMMV